MTEAHPWSDWLEVGEADLDNDHHLQVRLINSLVDALEEGRPWLSHRLAAHLHDTSVVHFESEEGRMRRSGDPERAEHQRQHDALLARMEELLEGVEEEDHAEAIAAAIDLRSSLAGHIGSSDRRLAAHELAIRSGPAVPSA
jgi:hemerythrin-like metal-binding protein